MNLIDSIKQRIAEIDKLRESLVSDLRKEFPAYLAPLFEKYPEIKRISWTQYTPYFNDGESCEFCVNFDISINGRDEYGYNTDDDDWDEDDLDDDASNNPIDKSVYREFEKHLMEIPEEFYEDLFGDHVRVVIQSNGHCATEEYSHD